MTFRTLIRRSLRFHARSHLGVVLGAAIGSAALIGALIVGDSVRETLRERALPRLANAWFALAPVDRFFRRQLEAGARGVMVEHQYSLYRVLPPSSTALANAATLLALPGTATQSPSSARANHVQVFGVQKDFWNFAGLLNFPHPTNDSVVLNEALAAGIGARAGDE